MNQKILFVALLFIFLSACENNIEQVQPISTLLQTSTATATTRPTITPAPTLTPRPTCPSGSYQLGQLKISYHGEIHVKYCWYVEQIVENTYKWIQENYTDIPGELHFFTILEELVEFEYEGWRKADGATRDQVIYSWSQERVGTAYDGVGIIFTEGQWKKNPTAQNKATISHEILHMVQHELSGQEYLFKFAPIWFIEGQAEGIARWLMSEKWDMKILDYTSSECKFTLSQLRDYIQGEYSYCIYQESEKAFILMRHLAAGEEKSLEVWIYIKNGFTFAGAFQEVYGITLSEFEQMFDKFRIARYQWPIP